VRVLVDTSYLTRGPSGIGVYIDRLVHALAEEGAVELVQVRQRRRLRLGAGNPLRSAANAVLDALWLHVGLPRAARLSGADVVHHPLPVHGPRIGVPQVSTVHDVAFAHLTDRYDPAWRAVAARAFRGAARRNAALVCVSETTAADAVGVLGADPARIVVAPHGPGQVEPGTPSSEVPADGHLLFVGDAEPRKNLDGLLTAYAAYRAGTEEPAPLVLAGASAAQADGVPGVEGRSAPTRADLVELLRGARALVHPSLHEGFGLTLLEAMALGVPVVAVASDGAREVCGDAALLVAPDGLAAAIARVAGDGGLRADLAARGRERAGGFSWAASARAHERAYTLACGAPVRADLP
jgi:glycosyltransferase involved in cell wall biosynthesis